MIWTVWLQVEFPSLPLQALVMFASYLYKLLFLLTEYSPFIHPARYSALAPLTISCSQSCSVPVTVSLLYHLLSQLRVLSKLNSAYLKCWTWSQAFHDPPLILISMLCSYLLISFMFELFFLEVNCTILQNLIKLTKIIASLQVDVGHAKLHTQALVFYIWHRQITDLIEIYVCEEGPFWVQLMNFHS